MAEAKSAKLIATGETVKILAHDPKADGAGPGGRYLCLLPAQAPGHKERKERINADKLSFSAGR